MFGFALLLNPEKAEWWLSSLRKNKNPEGPIARTFELLVISGIEMT